MSNMKLNHSTTLFCKSLLALTITLLFWSGKINGQTYTYYYTGAVQTLVVPANVTAINIKAWGSQGGSNAQALAGGLGGYAEGDLAVTPGTILYINVGGRTGFNGGGIAPEPGCSVSRGGHGGGATDVRYGGTDLNNRVIVAGGGGGAGGNRNQACGRGGGGGGGGGYYGGGGGAGWPFGSTTLPTGGTQSSGGIAGTSIYTPENNGSPGSWGTGGNGGSEIFSNQVGSGIAQTGGTGGGLTGADGLYVVNWTGQSGAGGSSFIGGVTNGSTTSGVRSGDGSVIITVLCTGPDLPSVTASANPICPNTTTTLNISGNLNQATHWAIYTGSCGGSLLGTTTGNSFNVTPAATTTYYVRGEGCGNPGFCGEVTVTTKTLSSELTSVTGNLNVCPAENTSLMVSGGVAGTGSQVAWYKGMSTNPADFLGYGETRMVNSTIATTYTVRREGDCNNSAVYNISLNLQTTSTPLTNASASVNNTCPGTSVDLTATGGTSGTGAQIVWYTGPNGTGSQVGTGSPLSVSPTVTTTYYARREGTCNTTSDVSVEVVVIPPVVSVSVSPGSVSESGVDNLVYTFSRTCPDIPLVVNFAVSGSAAFGTDYTQTGAATYNNMAGTVNIGAGVSSVDITVDPTDDMVDENDETLTITLAGGTGYTIGTSNEATGIINDDDTAGVLLKESLGSTNVTEGGMTDSFTVVLTSQPTEEVVISLLNGSQTSTNPASMITFNGSNWNTPKIVMVTAVDDNVVEGLHTGSISLAAGSADPNYNNIPIANVAANITDNDVATVIFSGGGSLQEGNTGTTDFTFTATVDKAVAGGFTLPFQANDGTATVTGLDYTDNDGTLTFSGNPGEMQTIIVKVNGDNMVENDETFTVSLGTPSRTDVMVIGSPKTATILNDDSATITLSGGGSQNEGNSGMSPFSFMATVDNPVQGGFSVIAFTNDGTAVSPGDYAGGSVVLTFTGAANESRGINPSINGDEIVEPNETFTLHLGTITASTTLQTNAIGTAGTPQTATILNDDAATITLSGGGSQNEGNSGTTDYTFTVTVDKAVQGGFTLPYSTNDGTATTAGNDYMDNDGTLSFAGNAGEMKAITVKVNGDNMVESHEIFTVSLGTPSNPDVTKSNAVQTGTIANDDTATLTLSGGDPSMKATPIRHHSPFQPL